MDVLKVLIVFKFREQKTELSSFEMVDRFFLMARLFNCLDFTGNNSFKSIMLEMKENYK